MSDTYTIVGTKPVGRANGTERWASIGTTTEDDAVFVRITAYTGWVITDEVRLSGRAAAAMTDTIARELIAPKGA